MDAPQKSAFSFSQSRKCGTRLLARVVILGIPSCVSISNPSSALDLRDGEGELEEM